MQEIKGNIFDFIEDDETDSICITTNGVVNYSGLGIMGAGVALEAAKRWPNVRANLGKALLAHGNLPYVIGLIDKEGNFQDPSSKAIKEKDFKCLVWSFPTKNDFRFKADVKLIERSALMLVEHVNKFNLKKICIPLPGCNPNTGKLSWNKDVRPLLDPILDDRFFICYLDSDKID